MLAALEPYLSVREDRALWQLNAFGSLRSALLKTGESMVREGRIVEAHDVLYLLPEEIEMVDGSDLSNLVTDRRLDWERWSVLTPPAQIGACAEPRPTKWRR